MSFALAYDTGDTYELRQIEHEENHVNQGTFEEGCVWCEAERCQECKGRGMTQKCDLCLKCNGRGRNF